MTVVALRQLERQSRKAQEHWAEEKNMLLKQHAEQLTAMEEQLIQLEQERNLLKVRF